MGRERRDRGRRPQASAGRGGEGRPVSFSTHPVDRVRFALWFCRRDLFEKVARPVTLAVISAVGLSAAASLMALALPGITAEVRLRRLAESPLARCVWVSIRTQDNEMSFSKGRLDKLDRAVRGQIARADAGVDVEGYQLLLHNF